ncbi:MAG: hypothetical protein IPH12_10275 [Saprospirales bacterium]|nr:hypothetical protein [Saprospirales bacterium]MBK8922203.1 hypothetical protein [Saprospirales bacterium]
MSSITQLKYSLILSDNSLLTSLDGINNLTSIGQSLMIYSNNALPDLGGLENLRTVGNIDISYNQALTELTATKRLAIT